MPAGCVRVQLCRLDADGRTLRDTSTPLDPIVAGRLRLPTLRIDPDWLTEESRGTATLVLIDDEPFAASDPAAAGSSSEQQWQWSSQPQKELGRFHLRLVPAAERLLVMAAGPLFKGMCMDVRQAQQTTGKASKGKQGTLRLVEVRLCLHGVCDNGIRFLACVSFFGGKHSWVLQGLDVCSQSRARCLSCCAR